MNRIIRSILCIALLLAISTGTVQAAGTDATKAAGATEGIAADSASQGRQLLADGYLFAAENSGLALYYQDKTAAIAILDKKSGKVWTSRFPEANYPAQNVTELIKEEFNSLFTLSYTLLNKQSSNQIVTPLEALEYTLSTKTSENGVTFDFAIEEINLSFSVSATIGKDGLNVTIPADKIKEGEGVAEQIAAKGKSISAFIDDSIQKSETYLADSQIPSNIKTDLRDGISEFKKLKSEAAKITSAVNIESESDKLLRNLNEIQNYYVGSFSKPGFFSKLLLSDKVSDEVKKAYQIKQNEFDDAIMPVKITISSLKAINVGSLVEISLLPYFGACDDSMSGYMLYPNGSGAITEFKKNHGSFSSNFKASTFSEQSPDIDWEQSIDGVGLKRTLIPYFGVKQGDCAFIGYVTQGKSESNIIFSPSGYIVNVNRIGTSFVYRRTIAVSNSGGTWMGGQQSVAYETEIGAFDASVQYQFLQGGDADYSGMARTLNRFMQDQQLLVKNPVLSEGIPLALDLFGGYNQKVLIFNNYIVGTTFNEASRMIHEIIGNHKIPLLVNFTGFSQNGYGSYPTETKAASQLGGLEGIQNLAKTVQEKGGMLFLQDNPLLADYSGKGYAEGDLALNTNLRIVQSLDKKSYLLSPKKIQDRMLEKYLPFYQTTKANGINLDMMGSFLYYDYSSKSKAARSETAALWQEVLSEAKAKMSGVAVTGGNEYVFPYADWIMNVPTSTSGYIYTDYGVPFYQMLIHGWIPYTSEPVNQYYDKQLQFLKSIEYGNLPYYKLTYNPVDTNAINLYVSEYSVFYEDVIDTYNRYSKDFSGITDQQMLSHRRDGDLVEIQYADGTIVYINYGDADITVQNTTIKPMNYHITKPIGGEMLEKVTKETLSEREPGGVYLPYSLGNWIFPVLLVSVAILGGIGVFVYKKRRNIRA